ncbi:AAA family ATPase [Dactylosporangium fulvum]|uniref:AAA family ATPase n=1 Tax=Dactylosporangium fulvum TaxID=53359 RepID=A0ABY5VPQ2_9ACTN|nr:AAA family ATPase [Dactylosporangium fulvum]UWP78781.1 AAA family ATPase [Dactylosporangium fulvum]
MRRFVLTGAPGAGKTTIVAALRARGVCTVAEAATDVIARRQAAGVAEPWTEAGFLDRIAALQRRRQLTAVAPVQVFDRSPVCTLALAVYSGQQPTARLHAELERTAGLYDRRVLLVRPLGFVTPTPARRISYTESLRFERIHEEVYREQGYELVEVPPAPVDERVALVAGHLAAWTSTRVV